MNWSQIEEANAALDIHIEVERRAYEEARREAEEEAKRNAGRN